MTQLFAQPYDQSASGFYFETFPEFETKAENLRNRDHQCVEEFEIMFIDGDAIDGQLFEALRIQQGQVGAYLSAVKDWDEADKTSVIIAVGEVGYRFDINRDDPGQFDVDLYALDTLTDLASHFVDEGQFGPIPKALENYVDLEAIGRDLRIDYGSVDVAGTHYYYRCD